MVYNFIARHMNLGAELACDSVEKVLRGVLEKRKCLERIANLGLSFRGKSWASQAGDVVIRR
jgi:hypothetical protein